MDAMRPLPWDAPDLATSRRDVIRGLIGDDHPFYTDAAYFSPPLDRATSQDFLVFAYELYSEIRALARDLRVLERVIEVSKTKSRRRSISHQSLVKMRASLRARLEFLETRSTQLPYAFTRHTPRGHSALSAGDGITTDLVDGIDAAVVDKIFPPLLAEYGKTR